MTSLALRAGCGVVTIIVRGEPAFGYLASADSLFKEFPESAGRNKYAKIRVRLLSVPALASLTAVSINGAPGFGRVRFHDDRRSRKP